MESLRNHRMKLVTIQKTERTNSGIVGESSPNSNE